MAHWPFYANGGEGLGWKKSVFTAKAAEICQLRDFDAEQAQAHADCLFRTWSAGEAARAPCKGDADSLGNYSSCILNAKGWLPDEGVALCTAGKYEENARYVDCIKKAHWPFYANGGEGLDWSKSDSTAKAGEICQLRDFDPKQARAHADCLFRTWSAGEAARSSCETMNFIVDYPDCSNVLWRGRSSYCDNNQDELDIITMA